MHLTAAAGVARATLAALALAAGADGQSDGPPAPPFPTQDEIDGTKMTVDYDCCGGGTEFKCPASTYCKDMTLGVCCGGHTTCDCPPPPPPPPDCTGDASCSAGDWIFWILVRLMLVCVPLVCISVYCRPCLEAKWPHLYDPDRRQPLINSSSSSTRPSPQRSVPPVHQLSNPVAAAQPDAAKTLQVQVPPGATPGSLLQVARLDGTQLTVQVPMGAAVGTMMQFNDVVP